MARNCRPILYLFLLFLFQDCSKKSVPVTPNINDRDSYLFQAMYDSIRSHPRGGGLFIVYIRPDTAFAGTVQLLLDTEPRLQASLTTTVLSISDTVAEILLRPDSSILPGKYTVDVVAIHGGREKRHSLTVDIILWDPPNSAEACAKKNRFKEWCLDQNLAYAQLFADPENLFNTYPRILIVEHFTFLTPDFELRLCAHAMIPPNDWSKIRIRRRGVIEPELAAERDTYGMIREIPVSEYPLLFGY